MSASKALKAAIKNIIDSGHYRNEWIADADLIAIIILEFDVPGTCNIDPIRSLGPAMRNIGHGDEMTPANRICRYSHSPPIFKGVACNKKIYYSYFLDPLALDDTQSGGYVESELTIGKQKCGFSDTEKQALVKKLPQKKEQQQPAQPPQLHQDRYV